jgi:hypothetical protein
VILWHQKEPTNRQTPRRQPLGRRQAQRDSVEEEIFWASLDSLSPGEEEGFALERRASGRYGNWAGAWWISVLVSRSDICEATEEIQRLADDFF